MRKITFSLSSLLALIAVVAAIVFVLRTGFATTDLPYQFDARGDHAILSTDTFDIAFHHCKVGTGKASGAFQISGPGTSSGRLERGQLVLDYRYADGRLNLYCHDTVITVTTIGTESRVAINGRDVTVSGTKTMIDLSGSGQLLGVSDPSKICVLKLNSDQQHSWRWKAYVPATDAYRVYAKFGDVPRDGIPKASMSGGLASRETGSIVEFFAYRDLDRTWRLKIRDGGGTTVYPCPEPMSALLGTPIRWSIQEAGVGTTEFFDAGSPAVLLRMREFVPAAKKSGSDLEDPAPRAGFMVWIAKETETP